MNPLGNTPPQSPIMAGLVDAIRFARSFRSPQDFLQDLQKRNPQAAQALNQLASQIKNPEQYAVQLLAQQGIDLNQLRSMLNG